MRMRGDAGRDSVVVSSMSSGVGRRRRLLGFNRPDADERPDSRMVEESGAIGEELRRKLRERLDVVLESIASRAWAVGGDVEWTWS
jgi:hypothetical protein